MLQKQPVKVNFAQGKNTKLDPWQLPAGNFQSLTNMNFNEVGLMEKRNGNQNVGTIGSGFTNVTTLNNNLTAVGPGISFYSDPNNSWTQVGAGIPFSVQTKSLVKNSFQIGSCDAAVYDTGTSLNNTVCTVWYQYTTSNQVGTSFYELSDQSTGQILIGPIALVSGSYAPRVFSIVDGSGDPRFLITYTISTNTLQYLIINAITGSVVTTATTFVTDLFSYLGCYDATTDGTTIYFLYASLSNGESIFNFSIAGGMSSVVRIPGSYTNPGSMALALGGGDVFYVFFYDTTLKYCVYTTGQVSVVSPSTLATTSTTAVQAITIAYIGGGEAQIYWETVNTYPYVPIWSAAAGRTDFITTIQVTNTGATGSPLIIQRGAGIASKAINTPLGILFLIAYGGSNSTNLQPSYFLLLANNNSATVVGKLAYSSAAGYAFSFNQIGPAAFYMLPSLSSYLVFDPITNLFDITAYGFPYLYGFQSEAVNKNDVNGGTGIYQIVGVNFAQFETQGPCDNKNVANSLYITGGIMNQYDGATFAEFSYNVWPDDIGIATIAGIGFTEQTYFYQVVYEWTDNQGLIHRSAPSIQTEFVVSTTINGLAIKIPTLRLTGKSNVRLVVYRASTAQPVFYQINWTPLTQDISSANLINDPTVDYLTFNDPYNDFNILGNNIIYTNGNVVENIPPGPCFAPVMYDARLFVIEAEDPNTINFSKQVINGVPVEMYPGFTIYVSPAGATLQSSGPLTALGSMDDKLILFKSGAIYYITGPGAGPDNTGANDNYSDPITISSSIGCSNYRSIVSTNQGLFFQASNGNGIWLLGRDLSTQYIGSPEQVYNANYCTSALLIPGTNQVRFHMANGVNAGFVVMYDYFAQQWGDFESTAINALSAIIYNGLHTFLSYTTGSSVGAQVSQETPGSYTDPDGSPVLQSFTSAWIAMAGLQGYQRSYFFYILGQYLSAHSLTVSIAYDYDPTPKQVTQINPNGPNLTPASGGLEQWRVFLKKQRCQAFQITIQENYTGTPGPGLTVSGLNIIAAFKSPFRTISAAKSVGRP